MNSTLTSALEVYGQVCPPPGLVVVPLESVLPLHCCFAREFLVGVLHFEYSFLGTDVACPRYVIL